ncbi:MAG: hypothetical protein COA79_23290 [Planctomycetota bacterium]|nr:MAG: hypothetical protein COA79_23290 [Planctomycetota bacterium]
MLEEQQKASVNTILKDLEINLVEFKEFLDVLEESFYDNIELAKTAILNSQNENAYNEMHSIRGSSSCLGLGKTSTRSKELEYLFKDTIDENSLVQLEELNEIFEKELYEKNEYIISHNNAD